MILIMKILMIPDITQPRCDTGYLLFENLIQLLSHDHIIAVCSHKGNHFHHVSLYPCPIPSRPLFLPSYETTYEAELKGKGLLSLSFLRKDTGAIKEAIRHFEPDIILLKDRIGGIVAAKEEGIPVISIVQSSLYTRNHVSVSSLHDVNILLREHDMEQILRLRDLYRRCKIRLGFGCTALNPYPKEENITRIGSMLLNTKTVITRKDVCIFLNHTAVRTGQLQKTIEETFIGAPCAVYVFFPGCRVKNIGNVHYLKEPRISQLLSSAVCFHDGNDFLSNACASLSIPQVIYRNSFCSERYNANAIRRNEIGMVYSEKSLSVSTLYESYRACITDSDLKSRLSDISMSIQQERNLSYLNKIVSEYSEN